ncbi:NC domain-containing-related-like protein [Theobroma cacao]|uniref:NC domain-containing-related-like protein n=1 Tax=Theobroma cacao TaxID=3641 RepID=A0A061F1V4_THECC|nr:NC domain-containing-related-like protein [Theobroma cacao]
MGQPQSMLIPHERKPQPGDHIYSTRAGGLYAHHGIYVGNDMVIHLQAPPKGSGSSTPCQKCGYKRDCQGGIIKTCLDCFLDGRSSLEFYEYGSSIFEFNIKKRGSCTIFHTKPADEVVKTANDLLQGNGSKFKDYNFFANNCEDFAVYCKTGMAVSMQAVGGVEAASNIFGTGSLFGMGVNLGAVGVYSLAKVIHDANTAK